MQPIVIFDFFNCLGVQRTFKPQNIRYFEAKQILLNESDFNTMRVPLINLKITLITDCMHSDLAISYLITIVYATLKSREIFF